MMLVYPLARARIEVLVLEKHLLLWEALRGQSVVTPDAMALASIAIWAVVTVLILGWIGLGSRDASRDGLDRVAI